MFASFKHNLVEANEKEEIVFIINPISGTTNKKDIPAQIKEHLNLDLYQPVIRYTQCRGDATSIAKKAYKNGIKKIVAVGGDGTVNEVAKALIDKKDVSMGILPLGSGNGLARHLEIPLKIKEALETINKGKILSIDYGLLNDIPFFCTCGVGFDALIGNRFAESKTRGFWSYFKTTVNEFFNYRPKKYILKYNDGKKLKTRAFLITFANASQYGNNAFICPGADIRDGKIDICIMVPFPMRKALHLGFRLFNKSIDRSKFLDVIRTDEVVLKRKRSGEVHYDGEPCKMGKKIKIQVVRRGLNMIVS
jgi:diacylglycerol kinase (ATP)